MRTPAGPRTIALTPTTQLWIAGLVPEGGSGQAKLEETILPRLQQLQGLADGMGLANVQLVFREDLYSTLEVLRERVTQVLQ